MRLLINLAPITVELKILQFLVNNTTKKKNIYKIIPLDRSERDCRSLLLSSKSTCNSKLIVLK